MDTHAKRAMSRRQFLRLLSAGTATVGLVACAPPAAAPQASSGAQANAPAAAATEIAFWDMVWGPPEYIDTAKKLVDDFNKQSGKLKVNYQSTAWSGWPQVFTTAIGSGSAPEISTGGGYQAVQFYSQGAIIPLDDVVTDLKNSGKLSDFLPGTVERLSYDGHTVALPWAIDIRVPYFRKDLFAKANVKEPTNWDELRAAVKTLTSGDQHGIIFAGNDGISWQQMFYWLFDNAGGFFTKDGKLDVMNERNVETVSYIADLVKDGSVHPGSVGFSGDDAIKAFGSGGAAFVVWTPGFEKRFPDLKENVALASPLTGPHGDKGTLSWVNNIMLYKPSKNVQAAPEFLKWWSENQKPLWTQGNCGQIPTRKSITDDPYFQNNPYAKQIIEQWIPIGQSTGMKAPGIFPVLNDVEGDGVLQTLIQDVLQGQEAKAALQKAETRLQTIVK